MPVHKLRFKADDGSDFPEWEMKRLGDVCEYGKGQSVGVNYVGTENMNQNFSGVDSLNSTNEVKGVTYCIGDTLMSNIRPYLKKTWEADRNGVCSTDVLVFRPVNVDSDFLYCNISSEKFVSYVMTGVKGSKMPRGDKKHIMEYDIPVPSLPEQQKIAKFLSTIDTVIQKQKETVSAWEKRKKGVMQKMFGQEVRFKADDGSKFPEWEEKRLGEVFKISTETNDDRYSKQEVLSVSDEYGVVNQIELQGRSFAGNDISKYKVVKTGQLIYTRSPLATKPFGIIKRVGEKIGIVSPLYIVNDVRKNNCSMFWYYNFDTPERTNNYLKPLVRMGAKHTMNISNEEWLSGKVLSPCLAEQQKIADCLLSLDEVIEKQKETLAAWEELKKGLLQQMFV